MSKKRNIFEYLRQHRKLTFVLGHLAVVSVFGLAVMGSMFSSSLFSAFAQSCASGEQVYIVAPGDTLGKIASRYNTSAQNLANHNRLGNVNVIYADQRLCIPGGTSASAVNTVIHNALAATSAMNNPFPYPQCTWWADQRFHQINGAYVPWTTNSDAYLWSTRARQYNWNVSSTPSVGAIINLQPWVQGARGLGHVAIVEQVLGNGNVIASNMNWGGNPTQITNVEFAPGPGVTFITR
ncbi:CHAP domain-containing protein [Ktedonosporobacter rubrisoli]|uniref:CHAP domain-containing protein n=1 Tax=Ktedonosporobacter rubrisoli TaxID=2509675 RepID=A0A4P6JX12_KTERU|nr:CHAP domain-containing protein [Ktedonosporobacter rubrisoli]QBD80278.1 CHAP domain-containing protein [Ktedonosporobacter rubrisoli]